MPQSNENEKYAPSVWGRGDSNQFHDLEVPSGQLCLVRRPGVAALMRMGLLNDLDSITSFVSRDIIAKAEGKRVISTEDAVEMLKDPAKFERILYVVDRIVVECVVKPEVKMAPNDATNRKDGVVYTDMIELSDKMFIFQYVLGGTESVAQFREEAGAALGGVSAESGDAGEAK